MEQKVELKENIQFSMGFCTQAQRQNIPHAGDTLE